MASVNVKTSFDIEKMIKKAQRIDRAAVKALKEASKIIKDEASSRAPVEDPNIVREEDKQLKHSIQVKIKKYRSGAVIQAITSPNYKLGFGGREAHLQEFGHIAQNGAAVPGKLWWTPAVLSKRKQAQLILEKRTVEIYKEISK